MYLAVMVMKGYFTLSRSPDIEPQNPVQFSIIHKTFLFSSG